MIDQSSIQSIKHRSTPFTSLKIKDTVSTAVGVVKLLTFDRTNSTLPLQFRVDNI
jgi:hypothetical protein